VNQFRKEDSIDPTHKWIGTYNANLVNVMKFFKWLYHPDLESTKRHKPKVVQNLARLKRREISGYKPSDMWVAEDNLLFLKYCPNSRNRCYHANEVDTSARPHELLKLRIKDVEFIEGDNGNGGRYAMDMDMVLDQKFFAEINQPPFKIAMDIVRHPISVQKTDNPIGRLPVLLIWLRTRLQRPADYITF